MHSVTPQLLMKVASVLEALADRDEQHASEKAAALKLAREQIFEPVLDKLSMVSGDTQEELRTKLSTMDESALTLLSKVAGADDITEMGGPGTEKSASTLTNSERATKADEEFASWLAS
jgi:hypothetical protein